MDRNIKRTKNRKKPRTIIGQTSLLSGFLSGNVKTSEKSTIPKDGSDDDSFAEIFRSPGNKTRHIPGRTSPCTSNATELVPEATDEGKDNSIESECRIGTVSMFRAKKTNTNDMSSSQYLSNLTTCPICMKRYNSEQPNSLVISHIKSCAVKHKVPTTQLFNALKLQKKQNEERLALGLPNADIKQAAKKTAIKKGPVDSNLELAIALSASLREAEEIEIMKETQNLLEAGLEHEAMDQHKRLENYGFVSSKPFDPAVSRSGKSKMKPLKYSALFSRTQEERERLINEKVSSILSESCDFDMDSIPPLVTGASLKSAFLAQHYDKNATNWNMSAMHGEQLESCVNEVPHDSNVMEDVQLSEVHSKRNTISESAENLDIQDAEDIEEMYNILSLKPPDPSEQQNIRQMPIEDRNFSSDWRNILGKDIMSDLTIYVKNEIKIPSHRLVFAVRCPKVLQDIIEETSNGVQSRMIIWLDYSYNAVMIFLEYLYCGSISDLSDLGSEDFSDLQVLCRRYNCTNLLQFLQMYCRCLETELNPAYSKQFDLEYSESQSKGSDSKNPVYSEQSNYLCSEPETEGIGAKNLELLIKELNESRRSESPDLFEEDNDFLETPSDRVYTQRTEPQSETEGYAELGGTDEVKKRKCSFSDRRLKKQKECLPSEVDSWSLTKSKSDELPVSTWSRDSQEQEIEGYCGTSPDNHTRGYCSIQYEHGTGSVREDLSSGSDGGSLDNNNDGKSIVETVEHLSEQDVDCDVAPHRTDADSSSDDTSIKNCNVKGSTEILVLDTIDLSKSLRETSDLGNFQDVEDCLSTGFEHPSFVKRVSPTFEDTKRSSVPESNDLLQPVDIESSRFLINEDPVNCGTSHPDSYEISPITNRYSYDFNYEHYDSVVRYSPRYGEMADENMGFDIAKRGEIEFPSLCNIGTRDSVKSSEMCIKKKCQFSNSELFEESLLFEETVIEKLETRFDKVASEPKTPSAVRKLRSKSKSDTFVTPSRSECDVTPMADYSVMRTPDLKEELEKYGLKPGIGKRKAKLLLRHIYDQLHPYVSDDGVENNTDKTPVKRKKNRTAFCKTKSDVSDLSSSSESIICVDSDDSEIDSDGSDNAFPLKSKTLDVEILKDAFVDTFSQQTVTTGHCDIDTGFKQLLKSDPSLHQKILLYEPVFLEPLKSSLKELGVKCNMNDLMNYLDEKCVTFRSLNRRPFRKKKRIKKT